MWMDWHGMALVYTSFTALHLWYSETVTL